MSTYRRGPAVIVWRSQPFDLCIVVCDGLARAWPRGSLPSWSAAVQTCMTPCVGRDPNIVTAGELAVAPQVLKTLGSACTLGLSHLLLVFNNPFARLTGFSGRERTPLPRYEQSEDLHRPIHPGHFTDERAAFKVEEVTEAHLRMV